MTHATIHSIHHYVHMSCATCHVHAHVMHMCMYSHLLSYGFNSSPARTHPGCVRPRQRSEARGAACVPRGNYCWHEVRAAHSIHESSPADFANNSTSSSTPSYVKSRRYLRTPARIFSTAALARLHYVVGVLGVLLSHWQCCIAASPL